MYDQRLDAIIKTAELGSFSKAAFELGYSTPALIKQVNSFEKQIGVTIFNRSNKGITLTDNGTVFVEDAKDIIARCKQAIERARQGQIDITNLVRVGISSYQSGQKILDLCQRLYLNKTQLVIQFVPIGDSHESYKYALEHLGERIDVIGTSYLPNLPQGLCNFEIIGNPYLCLAIPLNDELAKYDEIDVSDLEGKTIHVPARGNPYTDSARAEIAEYAPGVKFVEFEHYGIGVFNECSMSGDILLSKEIWRDVHPLLKTVDVKWSQTVPYCLYYAKDPSPAVVEFVDSLKRLVNE